MCRTARVFVSERSAIANSRSHRPMLDSRLRGFSKSHHLHRCGIYVMHSIMGVLECS